MGTNKGSYRTASATGTAEELLLRGERYRDTFGRNESENLLFLSGHDDNRFNDDDGEGATQRQTFLQRWGLRRPAWMASTSQAPAQSSQPSQYQPIASNHYEDDEDDNASAPSDTTTDVEAGTNADDDNDYSYSDDPMIRAQNKQRRRDRDEAVDANADDDGDADEEGAENPNRRIAGAKWYQAQTPGSVIALVAILLFFLIVAATLALVPMMRLVEDAICRRYYGLSYGDGGDSDSASGNSTVSFNTHKQFVENDYNSGMVNGTDERMCKVDAVQAELAWLGGVASVTEAIFGLLVSFPWALLSDRIGRKPVFRISFVGVALSFGWTSLVLLKRDVLSVWWVLTREIFLLVGGGAGVTVTILHAIVADVLVKDRASGFIWLAVGAVSGSIVGPACAALIMMKGGPDGEGHSAWLPICLTLFVVAPLILILTIFLPETLPKKVSPPASTSTTSFSYSSSSSSFWLGTIPSHMRETFKQLQKTLTVLRRSRPSLLLLPAYLFQPAIHGIQGGILAQSVSKRFGWSLAQTGYLFSFKGIVTVVVLILIPIVSKYILVGTASKSTSPTTKKRGCTGLGMSETRKDLFLARASLACLAIGNLLMATSKSMSTLVLGLVLSTLAVGFDSVTRSLITHFFLEENKLTPKTVAGNGASTSTDGGKDDHTSRLYTLTGMVETAGSVLAGPLLAWTFSSGISLGGVWIGLPFYYVTGLCVASLACLIAIGDGGSDSATDYGGRIQLSTQSSRSALDDGAADRHEDVGSGQIALP